MKRLVILGITLVTLVASCDMFNLPPSIDSPNQADGMTPKAPVRDTIFSTSSVYTLSSTGSTIEVDIPTIYSDVTEKAVITGYIGTSEMYISDEDEVFNAAVSTSVNEEVRNRGSVVFSGLRPMTNYTVIFIGQLASGVRDKVSGSVSTGGILKQLNPIDEWIRDDGFWRLEIDDTTGELVVNTTPQVMAVDYQSETGSYTTRHLENTTAFTPWVNYGYTLGELETLVEQFIGVSFVYYFDYQRFDHGIYVFFKTNGSAIYMVVLSEEITDPEVVPLQPPAGMTANAVAVSGKYTYFGNADQVVRMNNFDPTTTVVLEAYDGQWEKGPNDIGFIHTGDETMVILALGMTYSQHSLEILSEERWEPLGTYYCRHAYRIAAAHDTIFVSHGYDVDAITVFSIDGGL